MKIAHAQLHMFTNIMYKFQSSTCKTVGEKLQTKLLPRTDRQMDGHPWQFQYTPPPLRCGGVKRPWRKRLLKTLWEKEKNAGNQYFLPSFFPIAFCPFQNKFLLPQGRQKSRLCGKGLIKRMKLSCQLKNLKHCHLFIYLLIGQSRSKINDQTDCAFSAV